MKKMKMNFIFKYIKNLFVNKQFENNAERKG